jgi:hypothetical protein
MKLIAVALATLVAACSPEMVRSVPDAPIPLQQVAVLRQVATAAKLAEPVEYSNPITAPDISKYPWIICLRSAATEQTKSLTYSIFYGTAFSDWRLSSVNEGCASATYLPLPKS